MKDVNIREVMRTRMDVDMSDVISIAVSKAEQTLVEGMEREKYNAKRLTKTISEIESSMVDDHRKRVKPLMTDLEDSYSKMGINCKCSVEVRITPDGYADDYNVLAGRQNYPAHHEVVTGYGLSEREMFDRLTVLHKEKDESLEKALELKKKLSNLPSLERTLRARVAESNLRQIEGGDELIRTLTFDLDDQIKALSGY
jgi:hypothetical protein